MFDIKIQGTKQVIDKINKIEEIMLSPNIKKYIAEKMISVINRLAEERLSYDKNYIKSNKYEIKENSIEVYNDVTNSNGEHYSLILEYGSGLYADEERHIGKTDIFKASGYMFWYVPEEYAPELFDYYPKTRIETENGVWYKVVGQTPKHIYEDSAKLIERNIAKWVNEYIKKELGGKL